MKKKKNEASTQSHGRTKEDSQAHIILTAWETYASKVLTKNPMGGRDLPLCYDFMKQQVREVEKSQHSGVDPMAKYLSMRSRCTI